uniref:LRRCT domain-containing protein n=1 Tax=Syphacia muris TaxID=451379 RepID=A0A0N5ATT9_9BILA
MSYVYNAMKPKVTLLILSLYSAFITATSNKCPPIQKPCFCTSSKHEPIAVRCEKAASIAAVIKTLPKTLLYLNSLTISNTPVPELPPHVFKDFVIKKLSLRNNGMFNIHPEAFDSNLDSLEELELRSNRFGSIPQGALARLRNLKTLIISEDNISKINDYTFNTWRSKGILQKLELNSNYLSTIGKQGFVGLKALKQLSLDKNLFQQIPTDAFKSLPELEELSMSVNDIRQIPVGSLPLPNLKSLSFEVNQISSISADAFRQTPQILYLYLSGNLLTSIDSNMFYYISQLKVLAIGNNAAITTLSPNAFQYVPSLIRLEISDCSISYIAPTALQKMPKLQVITMRNNRLTRIERSTFSNLHEVVSIDIRQNKIRSVENFAFSNLRSLRHLDISRNQLENLPESTFYGTYIPTNPPITRIIYLYDEKEATKLQ